MKVERLPRGAVWISDDHAEISSDARILTTGPSWMLECVEIDSGTLSYRRDGQMIHRGPGLFGLFLPGFSVAEIAHAAVRWSWIGFSAPGPAPAPWLNAPMIFDVDAGVLPRDSEELLHLVAKPHTVHPLERTSRPSTVSRQAKKLLDATYRQRQSIAALADRLGVSHAHLTREFTRDYGWPPVRYRRQLRIMDANERLFRGQDIAGTAFDVGYNDLGRFYRGFRDVCDAPPGTIKKRQDTAR